MLIRPLLLSDYYNGYLNLLNQLSVIQNIDYNIFKNKWFEISNNKFHKIIVLQVNNKVIASGTLIIEPKFIRNNKYAGHIEDIVVNNNFRGNGYGKLIVEKLLEIANNFHCYRVTLNCQEDKFDFYRKFNFEVRSNAMRVDF